MKTRILLAIISLFFSLNIFAYKDEQFLSTKFHEINVRVGPSKIYPIKLIFKRKFLPLKVVAEYDDWKQVEDIEGDGGWIHISTLSKNRTVIFTKEKLIFRQPTENSVLIAKTEKNLTCRLKKCKNNWCRVQCENDRGWTICSNLWGVYKNECILPEIQKLKK